MVYFDWNNVLEPHLPSSSPLQIMVLVESMSKGIRQCIVDGGSFASILSSLAWKVLGSPKFVLATSELLDFDIIPIECLGILP
jgi:hypothetical protein